MNQDTIGKVKVIIQEVQYESGPLSTYSWVYLNGFQVITYSAAYKSASWCKTFKSNESAQRCWDNRHNWGNA